MGGQASRIEDGSEPRGAAVERLTNRAKGLARLQDLSTLTAEGRSRERYRRLALAGVTSIGSRGVGIVVAFVTVPMMLGYLGPERYGLWATVTSFAALLVFADLGLGQGLVNGISAAEGRDLRSAIPSLVASAFYMLVVVAAFLGMVFAVLYPLVSWDEVFNVSSETTAELAGPAVAVLVAMTLVGVPLGLVVRVRLGLQESFIANLWLAVGTVVSLAGLVVAIRRDATLPWLVFAFTFGPIPAASLLNWVFLLRTRPWLTPRPRHAGVSQGRQLLAVGVLFFVVQAAGVLAYQTDNIVIASIIDVEAVTQFAIPMQLFMLIPTVLGVLAYPLWPAYREALARGDNPWFTRTVRRSLMLVAGTAVLLSGTLALIATPLIHAWAGSSVTPSMSLVIALALYSTLFTISTVLAMFLFAVDAVKLLAMFSVAFVAVNLGLSIALTHSIGIPGPAWGSVIAMVPTLAAQLVYVRRSMSRLPSGAPS